MQSPAPFTAMASRGVRTRNTRPSAPASRSMLSAGVSAQSAEVTRTTRGPRARSAAIAAPASARVPLGRPVSRPSSNWLGVRMSAAGTARSRRNASMPGRT